LSVEDSLDDQLVRLILPPTSTSPDVSVDQDHEFRLVSEAVLRECIVNLARIKEAVSVSVQKPADFPPLGLDNVPQLVRGITAGLLMLGKGRAVELMDAIGAEVRKLIEPGAPAPDALRLERIADAIVSIEYYMETLQNGRTDPWYMLDNAETCIRAIDHDNLARLPAQPITEVEAANTVKLEPGVGIGGDVLKAAQAATQPPVSPVQPDAVDPQFVELFIEEAREEIASIRKSFPLWDQNPLDLDSLAVLRRSFHTLKGSGRMVGARLIAEFAWSIENLLNRILNKTLSRTPAMMALLRTAMAALPQLVEQLETGRTGPVAANDIMTRAFAFAEGRDPDGTVSDAAGATGYHGTGVFGATGVTSVVAIPAAPRTAAPPPHSLPAPPPPPESVPFAAELPGAPDPTGAHAAESDDTFDVFGDGPHESVAAAGPAAPHQPPGMDPLLHDIYSKETSSHLAEIRDYLAKRRGQPAPHDLSESVYRAVHTLSGSSKMAEARHGIRITEALNNYIRKIYESGHGLGDDGIAALADAVRSIEDVVSHIDESTAFFADQPALLGRLQELERELDAELARTSSDASGIAAAPPETHALSEAFDHEIANIYSEEATELLEAAQISLAGWKHDRRDKVRVAELQRQLHTLKGGARMAGIASMGDLSHELETLVINIESGLVPNDDHAYAVMQDSLDELARMRDLVSGGSLPSAAKALLAQIRALEAQGRPRVQPPVAAAVPPAPLRAVPVRAVPPPPPAVPPVLPVPSVLPVPPVQAVPPPAPAPALPSPAPVPAVSAPAAAEDSISQLEVSSAPVLPGRENAPAERVEMARVDAELLDTMLNNAGEVSIFRARLDQQVNSIDFNLAELARTVTRLKDQLRGLEIETEAQVLNRHQDEDPRRNDFDPLELDRYSALQTFSRALAETSGDVASIQGLLETLTREAQNLLTQQSRVITELQNSLMRTRMVPFQRHVQRLTRLVRQAANDTGKRAELVVQGAAAELDRQMLERMVAPLEHMLRNAVIHGIEPPERRSALGKPDVGRISVSLTRDGAEVIVVVTDDGSGVNVKLIREKAISLGMVDRHAKLTDEEAMQLILEPGFSTAGRLTQAAGRGVGMDVVATEVKKLGGGLFIESTPGRGSRFTIRLPFTLAISQALIVRVAEEVYALPLATVEGVVRLPRNIVARHLGKDAMLFEYGGQKYRFQQLGSFVGLGPTRLPETDVSMSVVLIRAGEHSTALVTDELVGSREIVVKSLGPQISGIRGIAGATILGDGRIVIILDMGSLVRSEWRAKTTETAVLDQRDRRTFALVVDDSITVRRVTQRLLERNGMRVLTAKDGVDAVSLLQENMPDIILLDIEMPRMDGYEVAAHVRNDPRLKHIPIVMITSRVSEKHRARAIELGVDDYLGKPYQESQLLDAIEPLVNRRSAVAR
jgi:chemosensory pili system protein ChpA (sensor histidine kinase/response regulator)